MYFFIIMKKLHKIEQKINNSKFSKNLVQLEKKLKKSVKTYIISIDTNIDNKPIKMKGTSSVNSISTTEPENSDDSTDVLNTLAFQSVVLEKAKIKDISYLLSVSVAESVTAGALSNTLCSEPGSSKFFLGGIVAYNMNTQEKLLNVDVKYAELNNFANPFTTFTMAKNVTKIFNSRIGLSTTGFSLPTFREEDLDAGKCEIDVRVPYAYICLYDSKNDSHKIYKIVNDEYQLSGNQRIQRAQMQSKIALECKKLFDEYCYKSK
jgi:PncC family amidohydrolase